MSWSCKLVFLHRWNLRTSVILGVALISFDRYKKPADLKRKKLNLHTVKPLYLHVNIEFKTE